MRWVKKNCDNSADTFHFRRHEDSDVYPMRSSRSIGAPPCARNVCNFSWSANEGSAEVSGMKFRNLKLFSYVFHGLHHLFTFWVRKLWLLPKNSMVKVEDYARLVDTSAHYSFLCPKTLKKNLLEVNVCRNLNSSGHTFHFHEDSDRTLGAMRIVTLSSENWRFTTHSVLLAKRGKESLTQTRGERHNSVKTKRSQVEIRWKHTRTQVKSSKYRRAVKDSPRVTKER